MPIKKPFVKKTAKLNDATTKEWAEHMKYLEEQFTKFAVVTRKIKQLLKKYDDCKNQNSANNIKEEIKQQRNSIELINFYQNFNKYLYGSIEN